MKLSTELVVGFALIAFVNLVSSYHGNCQPGCKTQEEIDIKVFRNCWDPTHYWLCTNLNETAQSESCPDNQAFSDSEKTCVGWDEWQWLPPTPPLSEPNE